ncbi:hypothetical protein GCM10010498_65030 [Streptomyces cavourensis]|nr:hypothetical protein GCM10010498_65030 [Streptomyces cavourensis]
MGDMFTKALPCDFTKALPATGFSTRPRADVRRHTAPGAGSRAEINVAPPPPTGPATDSPLGTP